MIRRPPILAMQSFSETKQQAVPEIYNYITWPIKDDFNFFMSLFYMFVC